MPGVSLYGRLFRYARLLVGHGWDTVAFWIATVYSVYSFVVPISFQKRVLEAVDIDPSQRLAIWGFGLAAFFLSAGFRTWSDAHAHSGCTHSGFRSVVRECQLQALPLREAIDITKCQMYLRVTLTNSGPPSVAREWCLHAKGHGAIAADAVFDESERDRDPMDPIPTGGATAKTIYFKPRIPPGAAFAMLPDEWKMTFVDAVGQLQDVALDTLTIEFKSLTVGYN